MKHLYVIGALLLLLSSAWAEPLRVAQVPLRAPILNRFVPQGWRIEKRVDGDLDGNGSAGAALVLVEDKPAKDVDGDTTERNRALVVVLREENDWRRVGISNALLLGTRDGGAFYGIVETPVEVSIARGVLIVEMESGSREVEETTHRLRFDSKRNGVFLIGFDSSVRDRLTGSVVAKSANFLTGRQKTTTMPAKDGKERVRVSRVSRQLRRLEILGEEERSLR